MKKIIDARCGDTVEIRLGGGRTMVYEVKNDGTWCRVDFKSMTAWDDLTEEDSMRFWNVYLIYDDVEDGPRVWKKAEVFARTEKEAEIKAKVHNMIGDSWEFDRITILTVPVGTINTGD